MITAKDTAEFIGQIMDVIENFLTRKGISFPETAQLMREAGCNEQEILDNDVILYGDNYSDLADPIEDICRNWRLIEETPVINQLIDHLKEKYPDLEIASTKVTKPNHLSYVGISVSEKGKNLSCCIDPDPFIKSMSEGTMTLHEAVKSIEEIIDDNRKQPLNFDLSTLSDYEVMKEKLIIQLIPVSGNETILSEIPHDKIADLALIYKFEIKDKERIGYVLITNNIISGYGITHDTLRADAMKYAPKNHPEKFCSMSDMLSEMLNLNVNLEDDYSAELYVGTVEDYKLGASVLAYPGFLEKVSKTLGSRFYIVPSSIHEVLFYKVSDESEISNLQYSIKEINRTEVPLEDRLSDNLYRYDNETKTIEIVPSSSYTESF